MRYQKRKYMYISESGRQSRRHTILELSSVVEFRVETGQSWERIITQLGFVLGHDTFDPKLSHFAERGFSILA